MRKSKKEEAYQESDWEQQEEKPSRTQKKKAAENLQKLGEFLVDMAETEVNRLDISSELKKALSIARTLTKHGARKRQLQYIGVIMREVDITSLTSIMEKMSHLNKS
ncbi:MAG: DUF615 domain-containing protein [Desulfamplus sp.]|nr:DUF615 domain-containing protein [Desulfamplus sp.]